MTETQTRSIAHQNLATEASLQEVQAQASRIAQEVADLQMVLARVCAEASQANARVEAKLEKLDGPTVSMTDAARLLGVSRTTLYQLIKRNEIVQLNIGGARRIRRSDIDDYIASAAIETQAR